MSSSLPTDHAFLPELRTPWKVRIPLYFEVYSYTSNLFGLRPHQDAHTQIVSYHVHMVAMGTLNIPCLVLL